MVLIQATEAIISVIQAEKVSNLEAQRLANVGHQQDEIQSLDSHILGLNMQTEQYMETKPNCNVEARAGLALGVIANLLSHSYI